MDSVSLFAHAGGINALAASTWLAGADFASTSASLSGPGSRLLTLFFSLGLFGVFLVSIVDSSFVPLPVPGLTDIMLVLYAAQHANLFLLLAISTIGSAIGGYLSHRTGQSGGMAFIEKRIPPRIFKRVTGWMESHAILSVALPAILPPPMPLSPFVLAAGALKVPVRKFMISFTLSRLLRHAIAIWLGITYGKHVLELWNRFSAKWGLPILIFLWTGIAVSVSYALWQIWKTNRSHRSSPPQPSQSPAQAQTSPQRPDPSRA